MFCSEILIKGVACCSADAGIGKAVIFIYNSQDLNSPEALGKLVGEWSNRTEKTRLASWCRREG